MTFTPARTKLLVSFCAALAVGAAAGAAGAGKAAPMIAWDILALTYCGWVWGTIWRMDAETTASHATREEPSRDQADLVRIEHAFTALANDPSVAGNTANQAAVMTAPNGGCCG